jgi:hypothetical protein
MKKCTLPILALLIALGLVWAFMATTLSTQANVATASEEIVVDGTRWILTGTVPVENNLIVEDATGGDPEFLGNIQLHVESGHMFSGTLYFNWDERIDSVDPRVVSFPISITLVLTEGTWIWSPRFIVNWDLVEGDDLYPYVVVGFSEASWWKVGDDGGTVIIPPVLVTETIVLPPPGGSSPAPTPRINKELIPVSTLQGTTWGITVTASSSCTMTAKFTETRLVTSTFTPTGVTEEGFFFWEITIPKGGADTVFFVSALDNQENTINTLDTRIAWSCETWEGEQEGDEAKGGLKRRNKPRVTLNKFVVLEDGTLVSGEVEGTLYRDLCSYIALPFVGRNFGPSAPATPSPAPVWYEANPPNCWVKIQDLTINGSTRVLEPGAYGVCENIPSGYAALANPCRRFSANWNERRVVFFINQSFPTGFRPTPTPVPTVTPAP